MAVNLPKMYACTSYTCAGNPRPVNIVSKGQTRGEIVGVECSDGQSLFLLTEHISSHQSTSSPALSFPRSRLSFALKQSYIGPHRQMNTCTRTQTHSHKRSLKCGFPIAPAHTKKTVSSDYQHCSLLASGASILDLFWVFFSPSLRLSTNSCSS